MISFEQHEAQKAEAKGYIERHEKRKADRSVTENTWQDCLQYIVPRKATVTTSGTPGEERGNELFDSTAIVSNMLLASALHGMLTNPAVKFFDFIPGDPTLNDDEEVKSFLSEASDRVFSVLNHSNFQTEIHEVYIDLGAIGTAALFCAEDEKDIVRFSARSMKEIYVEESNKGIIDTVSREYEWNLRQIVMEFGDDALTEQLLNRYKNGEMTKFCIVHTVEPFPIGEKSPKGHEFRSTYVLKEESLILSKDGFFEFPYAVPRWTKTTGEVYGRSPGMDTLADIKMVNAMMETTLQAAQLTVAPPLAVTDNSVFGKVKLTPLGITVVREMSGDKPIQPLLTDCRVDFGYQAVEDVRKRIRQGFMLPQIQLGDGGPMKTATETNAIVEEQLRFMGPVLGRQNPELLRPVTFRIYKIMERRKLMPPAPAKLASKGFDVQYSSLVARAQRMSEGQNLGRAIAAAAPIVNAQPQALDILDGDAAIRYIFDIYGVPQKLERKQRDIKQIRDARQQAQQQQLQMLQEQHQADVASKTLPGAAQITQATAQKGNA